MSLMKIRSVSPSTIMGIRFPILRGSPLYCETASYPFAQIRGGGTVVQAGEQHLWGLLILQLQCELVAPNTEPNAVSC